MTQPAPGVIERINTALADFLAPRCAALQELGSDLNPLTDAARSFVLDGGKRLRPRFAYWGWRSVRDAGAPDEALITAAASLELLHGCALVHDDVMDDSDTRRGRPSAHLAFAQRHRDAGWGGAAEPFGVAAAVLLGDLLLSWSDAMFTTARIDDDCLRAARMRYERMRELVVAGQYLDVVVQARREFSADEALRVIRFKTSKYTVEGPLHLGAAIAGAGPQVYEVLSTYGLAVGEAFQLRDDVLGVFGDPALTGKPAGDDLREGKQTLLTALAMQHARPEHAEHLRRDLGQRALDDDGIAALRNIIVSTGALDAVEERIETCSAEARSALDTDLLSPDSRAALAELIGAATRRHS